MDKSKLGVAILMIGSLIAVPVLTYFFGNGLSYLQKSALQVCIIICICSIIYCLVVSEITRNCSQVDKLWSILPIVYAWVIYSFNMHSEQLLLMAILVSIWGVRLTYNFSRRGAYSIKFWEGEEDYRWEVLRKDKAFNTPLKWFFFNFGFISLYQNALIFLFVSPMIICLENYGSLSNVDYILGGLIGFLIIFETIADQQQWNFHKNKKAYINDSKYAKGFVAEGLWKYSRHPNYFAEQSIWICFYFFTVIFTGNIFNWTCLGALLLIVLFIGSSNFSEEISAGKYPLYANYKKTTSRFIPWKKIK